MIVSARDRVGTLLLGLVIVFAACGDDGQTNESDEPAESADSGPSRSASSEASAETLTLVAYESFPESDTSLNDALDTFTADTGIEVNILIAGDTGTMLSKAELTAGNPEGDVMWGVDNTFLSRAIDADVYEPYLSPAADLHTDLTALVPGGEATPVDFGDVCVNYDIAWFEANGLAIPETLEDLTDPRYTDLLVVQNPATSSPGLAFLLATIDEHGADGWQQYWSRLSDNGVAVVDGWSEGYYEQFSWAGGGSRPMVVSYGSSPPAEVIFADPPRADSPTGVIESTCFRQVEFVGVLRGTDHIEDAQRLVDFLVGTTFQSELALNLFVYPANTAIELPQEFVDFAVVPDEPRHVDSATIAAHRSAWIDEWTTLVLG